MPPKSKRGASSSGKRTASSRAGILFPAGRVHRLLKLSCRERVAGSAGVYLASVLEYLCAELLELAGQAAKQQGTKRVAPRHLMLAIRQDEELDTLLQRCSLPGAGVIPAIRKELVPEKKGKGKKEH